MFRVAVFIDAGYLWKQLAKAVCPDDTKYRRHNVDLDYEKFRLALLKYVEKNFPGIPLLRCYWYDGALPDGQKSSDHNKVAYLNDFKLKLGSRIIEKEDGTVSQKGVDGLIIADLIGLGQNKVLSHALLISGDGDMVPGVGAAQSLGIRINLLGILSEEATSPHLRMEADFREVWGPMEIAEFAKSRLASTMSVGTVEGGATGGESVSDEVRGEPTPFDSPSEAPDDEGDDDFNRALEVRVKSFYDSLASQDQLLITSTVVPHDIDRRLIRFGYEHNGRRALTESQKREMRRVLKLLAQKN